jgi:hypothetical protein
MKVDQDDSQGKYRTRSLLERVRRLEKFSKHVQDHYSPERAKYDVEPPVMYEGDDGSYNMVWDDDLQAFRLSEQNSLSKIWTFKDDTNLNLNKTSQIDHSDHTKGEVKLAMTTVERQVAGASRQRSGGSDRTVGGNVWDVEYKEFGANVFSKAYANNGATSDYPAIFTYIPAAGYLVRVGTDHHIVENVANVGVGSLRLMEWFLFNKDQSTMFLGNLHTQQSMEELSSNLSGNVESGTTSLEPYGLLQDGTQWFFILLHLTETELRLSTVIPGTTQVGLLFIKTLHISENFLRISF